MTAHTHARSGLQWSPGAHPELRHDDPNLAHVVGAFQHFLRVLHVKVPRALCGVLLTGSPDARPVLSDDPACPRCVALAGLDASLTWVPGSA